MSLQWEFRKNKRRINDETSRFGFARRLRQFGGNFKVKSVALGLSTSRNRSAKPKIVGFLQET